MVLDGFRRVWKGLGGVGRGWEGLGGVGRCGEVCGRVGKGGEGLCVTLQPPNTRQIVRVVWNVDACTILPLALTWQSMRQVELITPQ